jgi:hypothetical protein
MARILSAAVIVVALAPSILAQATLIVPSSYPTIQSAINASGNGDTVLVSDGTYFESINFLGKAITVKSVRGPDVTTIDANHVGRVVSFENNEGPTSILEGFTLTNGLTQVTGIGYTETGAGIRCWGASPTIRRCHIVSNQAGTGPVGSCDGGGVYCFEAAPLLDSCIIKDNQATAAGGGIYARESPGPTLVNCVVAFNSAPDGGGITAAWYTQVQVVNCTIVWNLDAGLRVYDNAVIVATNSIVWGNAPASVTTANGGLAVVSYSDVQGGYPGTGPNINADPQLTGAPLPWHLRPTSPCLNAGTSLIGLPATDFEGDPRVVGPNVDIGADEFACTSAACAIVTHPVLIGAPASIEVLSPSPNAPIYVFLDTATGSLPLGGWGHTQVALSPAVIPLADWTNTFGQSLTLPYTSPDGSWSITATVPNDPQLVGFPFYCEGYVLDFSSPNGFFRQTNLLTIIPR